jgi:hypothetical protein
MGAVSARSASGLDGDGRSQHSLAGEPGRTRISERNWASARCDTNRSTNKPRPDALRCLHVDFHIDLEAALKQAGFPRVGVRGGGTQDWTEYFRLNPGKRDEAMAMLQKVTREFDRKNGTKISKYLDDSLAKGKPPTPPPSQ